MRWSERQAALLAEMGIRLWPSMPAGGEQAAERPATAVAGVGQPTAAGSRAANVAGPPTAEPGGSPVADLNGRPVVEQAGSPVGDGGGGPPVVDLAEAPVAPAATAGVPTGSAAASQRADGPVPGQAQAMATAPADTQVGPPSAEPLADAVRTLDWPALQAVVAGCTACTLCRSRTQTVFGVGHPRAHWMVVGEAPGEQEDRQGEPFVGRSGQLLDSMLRAIGLSRGGPSSPPDWAAADPARHVYIANTLKCRPPGNRNPAPDELARCEGYLIRQIELVQPKMILAMGRFAVQSLLRSSEPIGRLRGRLHRYHGVPLVVTYHPAYLLRNLPEKARAWDDLCLALDAIPAPSPPSPSRRPAALRADGTPADTAG